MKLVTAIDETIAAIASAPGHAERGVIRISGNQTSAVLQSVFEFEGVLDPKIARRNDGRIVFEGSLGVAASAYLWPTQRSYTGQPMAELHLPGSPALLEMTLEAIFKLGARPAERGEFTLRSFLAGRIDLPQAEAVLGVIDAFDFQELNVALRQLAGGLSGQVTSLRTALIEILADVEAGLDFIEEDIEFIKLDDLLAQLATCRDTVARLYEQATDRMQSTGRLRVVLAGFPNAGKSTLFNRLTANELALVSEEVGTTRDYLCSDVSFHGLAIELIDTAGWETAAQGIGQLAQVFRSEQVAKADLIVWCSALDVSESDHARELDCLNQLSGRAVLIVKTKSDLAGSREAESSELQISAETGAGVSRLTQAITEKFSVPSQGERQLVSSTASRSRDSLRRALASLGHAIEAAQHQIGDELIAMEIRESLQHLGEIVGAVYTDDVLDRVFSRFCIGK